MDDKPTIVFLTSRFPYPLDKGDKVRVYHQLQVLKAHFHVVLISITDGLPQLYEVEAITSLCSTHYVFDLPKYRRKRLLPIHFLNGFPLQIGYFFDTHIKSRIHHLLQEIRPAHIHVHLLRMVMYVEDYNETSKSLDLMDSLVLNDLAGQYLSSFPISLVKSTERKRIKSYESKQINRFQKSFIISERDKSYLPEELRDSVEILQNGVSLNNERFRTVDVKRFDILFCGNLQYPPNQQAVEFIKSDLAPLLHEYTIHIVGADMSNNMTIDCPENVLFHGWVDDIRQTYRESTLLIAPIFSGSGQQNKVLEALAEGIPVITTSFVNQSINAKAGEHLLIADSVDQFIKHIKMVLSLPEKATYLSKKGRDFVERKFSWKVNTAPLVSYIKRAVSTDE